VRLPALLTELIPPRTRVRFDRNELSGAFGDIGTDLPLLVLMISAAGMHPAGPLIAFGLCQLFSGLFYGMPMPVQPLKAVAVIVIAANGRIGGPVIWGAGLAIGAVMLALGLFFSAGFQHVVRIFPLPVLGVILLFEALTLMRLIGDATASRRDLSTALLVGLLALGLPYGFLIGMVAGTALHYAARKLPIGFGRA